MFFRAMIIGLVAAGPLSAAPKVLKVAAYELDPYITEAGEERGYLFDIVLEAFEKADYRLDIQFYPRLRAQSLVESGERDILIPTYSSSERNKNLLYSQPLHGSPIGYIKLKSAETKAKPVIASTLGDSSFDIQTLSKISPDMINSFPVEKTAQLIDMLNQKRLDIAIADKYVAAQAIVSKRPHLLGKIQFMEPPLVQKEFHVAFSLKNPKSHEISSAFNKALAKLQESGRYQSILQSYGYQIAAENGQALTIVIVDNEDMRVMQELSQHYLKARPGLKLNWIVLEENLLRRRILTSIALDDGVFDVFTIGAYDTAVYAQNGWIHPIESLPPSYDEPDLFPIIRRNLSRNGKYYALPFYGETSITYYRKDLFAKAGLRMPDSPTYPEISRFAEKLHDPAKGINGICLRGKAGWGENGALLTTFVHTFGGVWFDEKWHPQMNSPAWREAITYYADLLKKFGPSHAYRNGYSENLALFAKGRCAIWVDATVAASYLADTAKSKVAGKVGYALAPMMKTEAGRQWNWNWSLAVANSSHKKALATDFVQWATSKEYVALVAKEKGWAFVPPGTRRSTYGEAYLQAAPFAKFTLAAMDSYKDLKSLHPNLPYRGEVFVEIPEFPAVGVAVGNRVAEILKGKETVDQALQAAQQQVRNIMYHAGYYRTEPKKAK